MERGEGVFRAFGAGERRRAAAAAVQQEEELQGLHLAVQPVSGIQRAVVSGGGGEAVPYDGETGAHETCVVLSLKHTEVG